MAPSSTESPIDSFSNYTSENKSGNDYEKKLCSHDKCFLKAWPCFMAEKKTGTLYYAYTYGAAEICVVAVIVLFFDILQQTFEEGSEFIEI